MNVVNDYGYVNFTVLQWKRLPDIHISFLYDSVSADFRTIRNLYFG
jgi:hypothetical protein